VRSGTLERTPLVSGTSALVSESAARKLHLSVGDTLTVEGRKVLVGAIIQEFGTEHPLVQIDQGLFLDLYPRQQPKNLTIDLEPGAQISLVKGELERVVGAVGTVRDNRELREYALTLFDRTFRITLSIRWIVFSIALLGLVLASLQNLWERRREIKTMHLLGFSPLQIVGAHVVESAVVCALPVAIGLVGGVALGWGLTAFVNPRSFGWSIDFSLSVTPVVIAVGFIVAVAVVTLAATRVVLKRTIEEATLSDE
jgi:putative ABC transport system permease protein